MKFKIFFVIGVFIASLIPAVVLADTDFTDVYESEPVNTALDYLVDKGVVEGYDDGTFRPLNLINRAEFTKMVVEGVQGVTPDETLYKKCFSDVQTEWYAKYVCYAWEQEWVEGYDDGLFRPGDNITKAEALKIITVAFDWELESIALRSEFSDIESDSWYEEYFLLAEERELLDFVDYYISPHELISRKEMSEFLYRGMMYEEGEEFEVWELSTGRALLSYEEVLETGITAAYPGDMDFTSHSQSGWPYGCYAFATKNIVEWKYDIVLDMNEVQETIGWDGTFIWSNEEFEAFAEAYNMDVIFSYYGSAQYFFTKLAMGEPMIVYIPYYIGDENVGHQLVVYSFDENGVWVADSDGGVQKQIGYDEIFINDLHYTLNLTQLRQVKAGGTKKQQSGL